MKVLAPNADAASILPRSAIEALGGGSATNTWKPAVRAAELAASIDVSNPGTSTIGGQSVGQGDRVLLGAQTVGAEDGIYIFDTTSTAMVRADDWAVGDGWAGSLIYVWQGTNAGVVLKPNDTQIDTIGTFPPTWSNAFPFVSASDTPWKPEATAASTINVDTSAPGNLFTETGAFPSVGELVLLTGQTTGSQNGLYVYNGSAVPMTRHESMPAGSGFSGARVPVAEGTYADRIFRAAGAANDDVGVFASTWSTGSTVVQQDSADPGGTIYVQFTGDPDPASPVRGDIRIRQT